MMLPDPRRRRMVTKELMNRVTGTIGATLTYWVYDEWPTRQAKAKRANPKAKANPRAAHKRRKKK